MAIDIPYLEKTFFYFDKPVTYSLGEKILTIKPIKIVDSEIFVSSVNLLMIDKNSSPSVEIIQMSYLEFMMKVLLPSDESNITRLTNILYLCLGLEQPCLIENEKGKLCLYDKKLDILITGKQFEDIRRIILYQNIAHYDDSYINPELKEVMNEVDSIKNQNIETPSIERRMGIITAHCGLPKREQLEMTYRSHTVLFEEVCGEIEFITVRPIAVYSGKDKDIDHWIYKKKKNKYDGYFTSENNYSRSMGGDGSIKSSTSATSDILLQQYSSFTK